MMPINHHFMPQFNVPVRLCQELEPYDVDDKINGMMSYEVISKDENGIQLQIKHITPSVKLRKSNVYKHRA